MCRKKVEATVGAGGALLVVVRGQVGDDGGLRVDDGAAGGGVRRDGGVERRAEGVGAQRRGDLGRHGRARELERRRALVGERAAPRREGREQRALAAVAVADAVERDLGAAGLDLRTPPLFFRISARAAGTRASSRAAGRRRP